ncbi:putative FCP1 homology domain-containing protein C1271.03c [Bidens hawaiensis]|uniref:putative FCP1 homology domain-containing protein C1271.03c n=1 Tax=Bidens hawaiensis TaxID=980011 RepID=UPI00404938DB
MATKVWKIKKPDQQPTTKQHNPKPKPVTKNPVPIASSSSQQQQKHQTQTVVISLDRLNLGPKKKLLVIPLRGILVHRAHCSRPETIPRNRRPDFSYGNFLVYKRPYCLDFLKFCFQRFHVGLWSSAKEFNLQGNLTNVMGDLKNKLLFTWDQEHCTNSGFMCLENQDKPLFFKELNHLWDKKYPNLPWSDGEYSASNTLLITDPAKALLNPPNTAIFPTNYDPNNTKDDFLGPKGKLRVFLNGLAKAEDVQSYVESHPIGDPEITPSHPEWDYYCKVICSFNKKRNGDDVKLI